MEIKKIGVLGAGTMGSGIAQVAAQAGFEVVMRDISDEFVERGLKNIEAFLNKGIQKGKITEEDKKNVLSRIKGTTDMNDLKDVDFVIEAVLEDLDLKKQVFKELDELTRPEVVLTTNTSSMSITEIASATKRPDKVIGMHFFNPAPIMRLVEIIMGHYTSEETVRTVEDVAKKMGKETVLVKKDRPGFIVNRIMIPQFIEAMRIYEEGIASKEDIDKAVKLGLNYPMGPFELMDFTGVDIAYHVIEYFYREFKDPKWATPLCMKDLIRSGRLGRKTGAGWYDYKK